MDPEDDAVPGTTTHHASLHKRLTHALHSKESAAHLERRLTQSSAGMAVAGEHVMELEFEEWDGSTPFYQHCLAGSAAGVAEHFLMYPFDTLKTQIQSYTVVGSGGESSAGTPQTKTSNLMSALRHNFRSNYTAGFGRLWRGVQAMAIGVVPAHALYFSSYEVIKELFLERQPDQSKNLNIFGSSVAGASAALSHDAVMVPADTVKQRLQLGYYNGVMDAVRTMVKQEGAMGLYRALPVTLLANLPYGAVMVASNEYLRELLMTQANTTRLDVKTTLVAGCGAGMAAAAVTTPLDRLKTRLQTQGLGVVNHERFGTSTPKVETPRYSGITEAFRSIAREEGVAGFFRGMAPRLMTHTPSVAISWTVYEAMKIWLSSSG